jgi:hypothetical protein
MKLDDERIFGLVNQTWKSVLDAELNRVESGRPWIGGEPCVTASLRIAGAWGGSAQVRRPSAIALRVAAEVLAMEPKALGTCETPRGHSGLASWKQSLGAPHRRVPRIFSHVLSGRAVRGALGEDRNAIAGSLKHVPPAPSRLSLPAVSEEEWAGSGIPTPGRLAVSVDFGGWTGLSEPACSTMERATKVCRRPVRRGLS